MNRYKLNCGLLIFSALLVGLIHVSHHFLIPRYINDSGQYYPVTFKAEFDEAVTYGPRVQAAYLGMLFGGDISLAEHEGGPFYLSIINPYVLSLLAHLAGSVKTAFILSDFILPIVIFILVYIFLYEIFRKNWAAAAGGVIFIFVTEVGVLIPPVSISGLKLLIYKLLPFLGDYDVLYFNRFEYPNITFIFYLSALFLIYRSIKYEKRLDIFLAGLAVGSLFYTYLYDWVYVLCGLGIMGFLFLLEKNYRKAKLLSGIIAIALLCSFYYWLNYFALSSLEQYPDIISRIGVETGGFFRFFTWKTYVRSISIVWLLWVILKKRDRILWIYLSGLTLPIIIVLNLQIIAGAIPQPDHWYRELFFILFLSLGIIISWLYKKLTNERIKFILVLATVLWAGMILISEAYMQILYSKTYANDYSIGLSRLDSYNWLTKNTEKATVVAALSPEINVELLLHTHNKIYYPSGINSLASNQEIWERYMLTNLLFNVSVDDFGKSISPNQYMLAHLFHDSYIKGSSFNMYLRGGVNRELPENEYQARVNQYRRMKDGLSDYKFSYRIDYIYVDEKNNNLRIGEKFLGKIIYENNGIKIYNFLK